MLQKEDQSSTVHGASTTQLVMPLSLIQKVRLSLCSPKFGLHKSNFIDFNAMTMYMLIIPQLSLVLEAVH